VREVTIVDSEGSPILYASLNSEGYLFLEFEYFGGGENQTDYEFNHTVAPEEFPKIALRFNVSPGLPILENIQAISDAGRVQDFQDLLTNKEITNKFWSWIS
jgi:hypothetical protein